MGDCVAVSDEKLNTLIVVKQPDLSHLLDEKSNFFNTQLYRCKAKLQIMRIMKISEFTVESGCV